MINEGRVAMTIEEIARAEGISRTYASKILSRALGKLRQRPHITGLMSGMATELDRNRRAEHSLSKREAVQRG